MKHTSHNQMFYRAATTLQALVHTSVNQSERASEAGEFLEAGR